MNIAVAMTDTFLRDSLYQHLSVYRRQCTFRRNFKLVHRCTWHSSARSIQWCI